MKLIMKAILLVVVFAGTAVPAQTEIRKERVRFKPGEIGATISGHIKGDQIIDYLVGARAGQSMTVILDTKNSANYFNVTAPGEESAMFIGSVSGKRFMGKLPKDGDYTIRVYLMRSAARRGEKADYKLEVAIAGEKAASDDAKKKEVSTHDERAASDATVRAGQEKFDATGNIPCAQYKGHPMTQCEFGVSRAGGGYATVVIKKPDGRNRAIFFRMGKPIGADTCQADGYPEFRATKESDLYLIRVGDERYEIPDAVIWGG